MGEGDVYVYLSYVLIVYANNYLPANHFSCYSWGPIARFPCGLAYVTATYIIFVLRVRDLVSAVREGGEGRCPRYLVSGPSLPRKELAFTLGYIGK